MGIFLKLMREDKLRKNESKLWESLQKTDYDSKKYLRKDNKRIKYVNEIASRSSGKLPKREHGWYINKD